MQVYSQKPQKCALCQMFEAKIAVCHRPDSSTNFPKHLQNWLTLNVPWTFCSPPSHAHLWLLHSPVPSVSTYCISSVSQSQHSAERSTASVMCSREKVWFKPFVLELVPCYSISHQCTWTTEHYTCKKKKKKTDQNIHVSLSLYPVYRNKCYHLHH